MTRAEGASTLIFCFILLSILLGIIGGIARMFPDGCKFERRYEYVILPYTLGCILTEKVGEQ